MLYELHVGAFTAEKAPTACGASSTTWQSSATAVELMPLADFAGTRNWGYDGVMPFAPDAAYGSPDDLKRLIDEAHGRGLMMFLDVVYNHFGPEGNYLHRYAKDFFEPTSTRPGAPRSTTRSGGARFRAPQRAVLARGVPLRRPALRCRRPDHRPRRGAHPEGDRGDRQAHDPRRAARPSGAGERQQPGASARARRERRPVYYDAQWNDDIHHVYHHLLTGEAGGYYADYASGAHERSSAQLRLRLPGRRLRLPARCGARRAERHLPPTAFVGFIQNHDQVGNRAFGERIADLATREAVQAMQAILLLAPQIPLLFMGEEWGATQPSASSPISTTSWRTPCARAGGASSAASSSRAAARAHPRSERLVDLCGLAAGLVGPGAARAPGMAGARAQLLRIRHEMIVPRLGIRGHAGKATVLSDSALRVAWALADGSTLELIANLADRMSPVTLAGEVGGDVLFANHPDLRQSCAPGVCRRGRSCGCCTRARHERASRSGASASSTASI